MRVDTTAPGRRDLVTIWDATCSRIAGLFDDQPVECVDAPVVTVPGATVRDVLLHLSDLHLSDLHLSDDATDDVLRLARHRPDQTQTLQELLERWKEVASNLGRRDEATTSLLITGVVMGEHDLRAGLSAPGARNDVAVKVALDELSAGFSDRAVAAGLPPLRVTVEQWGTVVGDGPARSCVVADRFEFVRAMSGRRSAAEISRWNWGADPTPYLDVIAENGLPVNEIRERDPRVPEHMRDREFVL